MSLLEARLRVLSFWSVEEIERLARLLLSDIQGQFEGSSL